jgi:predicted O-methyltransferase YrrM
MIKNYSEVGPKVESVEGLVSPDESAYLFDLVTFTPSNATIVEIGSHCGKSSIALGFACIDTDRKIYCIDCWLNELSFISWKENVKKFDLEKYITPIKEFSGVVFQTWSKKIDLIFIDGNHGLTDVTKDFVITYPFVNYQGVMAFHDCDHPAYPGVRQFWDVAKSILGNHGQVHSIVTGTKLFIV